MRRRAARPGSTDDPEAPVTPQGRGTLWVPNGAYARAVRVRTGLNDGTYTEVSAKELSEGIDVITGEMQAGAAQAAASGETKNPFVPQMPAKSRSGR